MNPSDLKQHVCPACRSSRLEFEATTNLAKGWAAEATVTNEFGSVQFNDPFVTNRAQRFYRARPASP